MTSQNEIEVKLRVRDLAALRRRFSKLGIKAKAKEGRVHEKNLLFDTPDGGLAKHGQLLRVRVSGAGNSTGSGKRGNAQAVLTYKGPATRDAAVHASRYKVREEFEVGVADSERLGSILEALGLRGWFRYEKYRTSFQFPASARWAAGLHIELDETPIGAFLELEGPPEAIDRTAELLGYRDGDYITRSYLALYLDQCRKQGVPAGDMVFPSRGK